MKYEKFNEHCFYKHKEINLHFNYVHRIYGGLVLKFVLDNSNNSLNNDMVNEIWLELYKLFNDDSKIHLFYNVGVFYATLRNIIKKIKLYLYRDSEKYKKTKEIIKHEDELFAEIEINDSFVINKIKSYLSEEEFELLYDFYFLEMTNEEMGIKYNKPKTTIRDRRIKIQKKLKEVLLDDGYDFDDLTK